MSTLTLISAQGTMTVTAVEAAEGIIDFVKTMKQEIKTNFGILKNWAISEDGKIATSNVDESTLELTETIEGSSTMAKTLSEHAKAYEDSVSYSGGKSKICGDAISKDLQGLNPDQVIEVAEKILDLKHGELAVKYDHLNPGQKRMNSGNRIRGAVKKGTVTEEAVLEIIATMEVAVVDVAADKKLAEETNAEEEDVTAEE